MRTILVAGMIAVAGAGAAQAPQAPADGAGAMERELIALERESWDAWQRMDVAFWQRHLSADHVEVHMGIGATNRDQVIRGIAGRACTVASYQLDRFSFRQFDADTAVLVYRAAQDTTCGGFRVPSPVWATSLYQRRGGRWENLLYVHTPIPPRPAAPPTPAASPQP